MQAIADHYWRATLLSLVMAHNHGAETGERANKQTVVLVAKANMVADTYFPV